MNRPIAWLLLLLSPIVGCGEAELPRFVPAAGNGPASSPADRRAGDSASREVVVPKNIPMH